MSKRQQRAAATADQLLAAAREVFESRGYQGTTVGAITKAANTAHGTFYLYFKNKEDAFAKVMAQVTEEMYRQAGAPRSGDARSTLAAATQGFLEVFQSHRGLWRCLLEGMHQSKAIEEMWLELREPFIDRIARNLEKSVESGLVRPMDTRLAAYALGSMAEWVAYTHFELHAPGAEEATPALVAETLTDLWYHAVYGTTPDAPIMES